MNLFDKDAIMSLIDDVNGSLREVQSFLGELSQMADGIMQLESASMELEKAELELDLGEQQLNLAKSETQTQLDEAKAQLDEAKAQIDEAQAEIDKIPKADCYYLDEMMNEGVASFDSDADRIEAIAKVFPMIFFLVAALVSLTTMTRMVEEQRGQTGCLRALGYSRFSIMAMYMIYASLATLVGAVLGILFGMYFLPAIIYGLYQLMMYDVPLSAQYTMTSRLATQSVLIAWAVTLIATVAAAGKEMTAVPAVLMRPKAPKTGKRILLERVDFIWKRLNFNRKVTMRNLFRYKKRCLMSIVGIAGCTALLVTGFGLKYSLSDMTTRQFGEIWLYDGVAGFNQDYDLNQKNELKDELGEISDIDETLMAFQETGTSSSPARSNVETHVLVPENPDRLDRYFTVRDLSHKELTLGEDGVIVTQKLCEMLDIKVGDNISVTLKSGTYEFPVVAVAENYMQHFVYMMPSVYEQYSGQTFKLNTAYFNLKEDIDYDENRLGKQLMDNENINSVSFTKSVGDNFNKQMNSVDIVVWVLIIAAGLLAFVVLYNLTNININERVSEIATIKVLGFRNHEVYDYIFRENNWLSVIGALLGLFLGVLMHRYIMTTVEVDLVMFVRTVKPVCFVISFAMTYGFTWLINHFMRRLLRKVDMVSSLKSVE